MTKSTNSLKYKGKELCNNNNNIYIFIYSNLYYIPNKQTCGQNTYNQGKEKKNHNI